MNIYREKLVEMSFIITQLNNDNKTLSLLPAMLEPILITLGVLIPNLKTVFL